MGPCLCLVGSQKNQSNLVLLASTSSNPVPVPSIIEKKMTIYRTPAKHDHDDEEHRGLVNVTNTNTNTKNPTINVNVRLSTVAILLGCGILLGAGAMYGPLSGSSKNLESSSSHHHHQRALSLSDAAPGTRARGLGRAFFDPKTVAFKAPAWKTAARACEQPVNLHESWYKSQSAEDRHLQRWFKDICHGTYMEIGGLDGVTFSNTYVYNKGLNWSGVLVEASPMNYQQLVRNRPNEIANVHAGVCEKEMDLHWVQSGSGPAVGGFQEFAHPDFQKRWWSEDDIKNAQVIKCHTLEQILLDKVGPGFYFDFFSLDVEGAELSVLRSINFDLVGFGVILMEADRHNPTKNMAARELLESNGYMYLEKKSRSEWFVNQDFGAIYKDLIHPGSE